MGSTILGLLSTQKRLGLGRDIFDDAPARYVMLETLESKLPFKRGQRFLGGVDLNDFLIIGARSIDKKVIYYESTREYEAFDLMKDPLERCSQPIDFRFKELKELVDSRYQKINQSRRDKIVKFQFNSEKDKKIITSQLRALGYIDE